MENLEKLTSAGLPAFDMNSEDVDSTDWSQTPLGPRESWPLALKCLVNSCVLPMPHCAAIFWGKDLSIIHNLAWGKARGDVDTQGAAAHDSYSHEALSSLRNVVRGRTVKVASRFFLPDLADEAHLQLLLSPILDENGTRQGVLAQLLEDDAGQNCRPFKGLQRMASENPASQLKQSQTQQDDGKKTQQQPDSLQTQLFQRFAELIPNGLAILDKEAEAVFVNDGFFKLTTNKHSNEFRAWPESIHPEDYDRVMTAYRKAFSSRKELRIEFRCASETTGDGPGEQGEWRLFLLRPLNEDADAGFISAVVDITEIKQAQLAQERAATEAQERKEQQERFIDMVSHEIRNPLSAVLHLAEEVKQVTQELADEHDGIADKVADILDAADTILLCVSHQNTLVDDILSFSKLDSMMLSLVPREVRPKWEFSRALKVFQSEFKAKKIKFHYAMDVSYDEQGVDYVVADLNRMKQVLVNLITNAIKFTARKNGERNITVSMGASTERPTSYPPNVIYFSHEKESFHVDSTMSTEWGGGASFYLMVAVKDTGIGISQEGQAKLFERFRQATPKTQEKYGGSGLGLFISRKLCQLHGGDIGVSSKDGEGSTFGFFFKVRRAKAEDGRPLFQSRSNSETSQQSARPQTPRPGYNRANSNLQSIKEKQNERPEAKTQTSYEDTDIDEVNESLENPPTEYRPEAHPESSEDSRYKETERIASQIVPEDAKIKKQAPSLAKGETRRQHLIAENTSKSQSKQPPGKTQTLLLVEDNLINQKVLRRQLQSRGFEVFIANNGQEAIDAVAERGKAAEREVNNCNHFDCILMDQEMPIKDGNAATQEIRQLQKEGKAGYSRILGVSANVRKEQTASMREAGMDDIISKPFKVEDLVKRIGKLVPGHDGGQGCPERLKGKQSGKGEEKQPGGDGQAKKQENGEEGQKQNDEGKEKKKSNEGQDKQDEKHAEREGDTSSADGKEKSQDGDGGEKQKEGEGKPEKRNGVEAGAKNPAVKSKKKK
ncbi:two component histidine kinase 1 [Dothidotthia symphoricarpi CBS 119687]|uniref:Two component histidine kinase 1 n=1 Tax=Dothidotthia symphoricarpi CBS 119687 TaxID=1392245 RepID=A0A6A6AC73_9PLEO|nr:two component histidine kinase 1 [Dothidotthia symphoricarpi CBS 119687]KAF2128604.1 two component histidine kinase 1 [Dothidotthia symphoricarpi CBS 119687]